MKTAEEFQRDLIELEKVEVSLAFIRQVQADALRHAAGTIIYIDKGYSTTAAFDDLWAEAEKLHPRAFGHDPKE